MPISILLVENIFLISFGLGNFKEGKRLSQYTYDELACMRPDFEKQYYKDPTLYIVSGHTGQSLTKW